MDEEFFEECDLTQYSHLFIQKERKNDIPLQCIGTQKFINFETEDIISDDILYEYMDSLEESSENYIPDSVLHQIMDKIEEKSPPKNNFICNKNFQFEGSTQFIQENINEFNLTQIIQKKDFSLDSSIEKIETKEIIIQTKEISQKKENIMNEEIIVPNTYNSTSSSSNETLSTPSTPLLKLVNF
jgi:hypothetical protein